MTQTMIPANAFIPKTRRIHNSYSDQPFSELFPGFLQMLERSISKTSPRASSFLHGASLQKLVTASHANERRVTSLVPRRKQAQGPDREKKALIAFNHGSCFDK